MRGILDLQFGDNETSRILEEEARANNVKYIIWHPMEYHFLTKKPVRVLTDLDGMKMRSLGIYEPKVLEKYGAIAVAIMPAEWYESISRGTLDGLPAVQGMIVPYKLQEVAKYASYDCGRDYHPHPWLLR